MIAPAKANVTPTVVNSFLTFGSLPSDKAFAMARIAPIITITRDVKRVGDNKKIIRLLQGTQRWRATCSAKKQVSVISLRFTSIDDYRRTV